MTKIDDINRRILQELQRDGRITNADLFHLAPLVCLKFRGRKLKGPEAKRVREVALANYDAMSQMLQSYLNAAQSSSSSSSSSSGIPLTST
jgi:hypothetical protein